MRKLFLLFVFFILNTWLFAQVTEVPATTTEQQLENITENNEDAETEDDSYLQEMVQFLKNPVNLNTADDNVLKELKVLSPIQIQNLISYKNILGKLVNLYELQAIPGWDLQTIRKVRPYITVSNNVNVFESVGDRLRNGDHTILVRVTQVLERSGGYLADPATTNSYYPGSPQKLFLRYKYIYKNLLQYGIVAEKDAGEQFFKGNQRSGFDFYSAHVFLRDLGIIKSLALGDFTVNMGQGLTQWQSLAFKKGPDITTTKRQSAVLRPYNSAGEINFHRGVGITIGKNNWEATVFGSYRKLDANFVSGDTLTYDDDIVSSLQTSGYHRTKSEVDDKNIQRQIAFGGNLAFQFNKLHIGVNAIQYQFKYPLVKDDQAYNSFALNGKSFGNYSTDYSYTFRNMHIFGELASNGKGLAFVNGLLISVSANVDMSFLYRNINKEYQSLYTNAFTENTYPTNEKGLFSGISIRPATQWQLDAYVDMYKFPWLKFGVNAPSGGSDYFIQLSYRPNKQLEIYTRFKREAKGLNLTSPDFTLYPVLNPPKQDWRTQFSYKVNQQFTVRSRAEMVWFSKTGPDPSQGFLMYADVIYKPIMKPFSANVRLQYFQTDDYNSRLYAYENDVLYSFSIPVFYDKGYRYYLNINYDLTKKLTVWGRIAQTINPERTSVGSGLDEIKGNRKIEVKLQMLYKF